MKIKVEFSIWAGIANSDKTAVDFVAWWQCKISLL